MFSIPSLPSTLEKLTLLMVFHLEIKKKNALVLVLCQTFTRIHPIHKKGDGDNCSYYSPISLTSCLSKVYE